jgi:hypothetical protein
MKTFTLLPNPFTEAPVVLLEELYRVTPQPAGRWYIPATPFGGKAVELYARGDFRQLITHDCDLDLDFLDLKASVGGWFVFTCEPPHALEHYRSYEMRILGRQEPHKTFGCKRFEIYESDAERLYVPTFEGTYETQIECAARPINH